jgi:hypothetical protein
MSKLNQKVKTPAIRLAGGQGMIAAKQPAYQELRRCVLANLLFEDLAYIDGKELASVIETNLVKCSIEEVLDLAVEARLIQKLRHIPLYLIVLTIKHKKDIKIEGQSFIASVIKFVCSRADMITDLLALYFKINPVSEGKKHAPIANVLKEGIRMAFDNFNEYQLAKYANRGSIKLRDAMFLCRPKPNTPEQTELFKKLANKQLTPPETWEVLLSSGADKLQTWMSLIQENKLGGLAMLRNIRNMVEAGVSKEIILKGLYQLKTSMLLPFNYFNAAKINPEYSDYISEIMVDSYKNLPKLPGNSLFIIDMSGSMGAMISSKSTTSRMEAACLMGMLAFYQSERCKIVLTAGSYHYHSSVEFIPDEQGFKMVQKMLKNPVRNTGGGIFTRQCLEWCKEKFNEKFERIIVFSDSQDCDRINKTPKPFGLYNYICDVSAHNKGINFKGCWTAEISGFSENFLTYIAAYEGLQTNFEA